MNKEQSLNGIFAALSGAGIEVVSMRNKANRLEELFLRLVEGRDVASGQAKPAGVGVHMSDSSMGVSEGAAITGVERMRRARKVGFYTIVIREFSRIIRIWGQTIVPSRDHRDTLLHHLRQPDRAAHRRHGRLLVHAVHRAGPDHDGRDHQQLRQRGFVLLRRQVRASHRRAAGLAAAELADRAGLRRRVACCADCSSGSS